MADPTELDGALLALRELPALHCVRITAVNFSVAAHQVTPHLASRTENRIGHDHESGPHTCCTRDLLITTTTGLIHWL